MVIFPASSQWKRDQNALNSPASFQAKCCPSVINQIKFNITSSSQLLPCFVSICERCIFPLLYDRKVCRQHRVRTFSSKSKKHFLIVVIKIIKKNSTEPSSLATVLDVKVIITPFLETRIEAGIEFITCIFLDLMEVPDIFFKYVSRGKIGSTTKPPLSWCSRNIFWSIGLKVTIIKMQSWSKGVFWMHNRADASSKERNRARLSRSISFSSTISIRRHNPINNRHIDPSLLPNGTVLQHSAYPSTTTRPRPHILLELPTTISSLNRFANPILSLPNHLLEPPPHRRS
uniref:Uncharacterized protein n=1 Tax=Opuntia streptacantha TaxID=393608 RepID=A0A7C9ELV7_OPUST